jgi:hypothetical protein
MERMRPGETGEMGPGPLGLHCARGCVPNSRLTKPGLALPSVRTQPAFAADSACVAGGFRTDALVDVVAHMRSAKGGLVTHDCCCRTPYRASRT